MKTELYNQKGENIGMIDLPEEIFGVKLNMDLIHQALIAQNANKRTAVAHAKGRGEVRGGGKKPWKQKGTGRARHGSIRSPIWKGGGVTGGPTNERNFSLKLNKKMKRQAIFSILSSKLAGGDLLVVDKLEFKSPKTKIAAGSLKDLLTAAKKKGLGEKKERKDLLVAVPSKDENLKRALSNISYLKYIISDSLNAGDLLSYKYLLLAKDSIDVINKIYNK
ncbi:MAG: 50S ribosomal protein L4 [Patescibacteria group bacterium]